MAKKRKKKGKRNRQAMMCKIRAIKRQAAQKQAAQKQAAKEEEKLVQAEANLFSA